MKKSASPDGLDFTKWDIAVSGPIVDDRGEAAVAFARTNASKLLTLRYDEMNFEVNIHELGADALCMNAEDIGEYLRPKASKRILLETTTMGFVEIFLCSRALQNQGLSSLDLLYVEPLTYHAPRRSQVLHRRDFELSDIVPGYRAIPGAVFHMSGLKEQHAVFLLGYEEHRFGVALEDFQQTLRPEDCSLVFGVPAFQPGWEMNSLANNLRIIRGKNFGGGIHFCGAENPGAVFDVLAGIRESLTGASQMFVAPIGTKPMGIAAALFAVANPDVGLLYDHPKRRPYRSSQSTSWHLYEARF